MIKFILAIVGFLGIIASAKYPKKSNELGDNFNIGGRLFRQSYLKWGLLLIAFALIPFFNSIIYDKVVDEPSEWAKLYVVKPKWTFC